MELSSATMENRLWRLLESMSSSNHDALLDAFLVLNDECTNELSRNQYAAAFSKKNASLISKLKALRLSVTDFVLKRTIRQDQFMEFHVVSEKSTGELYTMKVLRKMDLLSKQNARSYQEERDIMANATSIWISKLQFAFQDQCKLYLVMDYYPGGSLLSHLSKQLNGTFDEDKARFYLCEIVRGAHALHDMGFVHRNIKLESILIDCSGHIKLADFGTACEISSKPLLMSNLPNKLDYVCPEILMKVATNGEYIKGCDWWCVGVCLYHMLYGRTPFTECDGGSMLNTFSNIVNHRTCLKFPSEVISEEAKDLIQKLLTDVAKRLIYKDIRDHRFFSAISFRNIRQTHPPCIPTVSNSGDAVSEPVDFDVMSQPVVDLPKFVEKQNEFCGSDLPFVGFTFTNRDTIYKSLSCGTSDSTVLHELQNKCCQVTYSNENLKMKIDRIKSAQPEEVLLPNTDYRQKVLDLTKENQSLQQKLKIEEERGKSKDEEIKGLNNSIVDICVEYLTKINEIRELKELVEEQKARIAELEAEDQFSTSTSASGGFKGTEVQLAEVVPSVATATTSEEVGLEQYLSQDHSQPVETSPVPHSTIE